MNIEIHWRFGTKLPYDNLAALQSSAKFGELSGRYPETFFDSLSWPQLHFN